MKIGNIEAAAGEKAYGFFKAGETHGRFPAHIPLHIVNGAAEGPTLVVQAGASGLEIEPSLILPQVVQELDPAQIRGTLILAPLMNTSGFEFARIKSVFDDKHLNQIGSGDADGSISEQLVHAWYQATIAKADALLDIRTGSQWSYHHFVGVNDEGDVAASKALAIALGLPQVVLGKDEDNSMAQAAARAGKAVAVAFIGGGPGLRDYRDQDLGRMRNAVLNAMRHLGMLDGALESDVDFRQRHPGTLGDHAKRRARLCLHGQGPARPAGRSRRRAGIRAPSLLRRNPGGDSRAPRRYRGSCRRVLARAA